MEKNRVICRGDIYWTKFKPHTPVIVVSNDTINETSDHVLIVPMTKTPVDDLDTHCTIRVGGCSTALVERLKTMKKEDLGKFIDTCSSSERMLLDLCLVKALALDYLLDTTPEKDEYRAAPEVVLPMDLAKEYVQHALSQEEEKAIQEGLAKVYAPGGVVATTEEEEPIAMAIVEGESEPRVVRKSEIIRSRDELRQILDEATEKADQQDAPEEEQESEESTCGEKLVLLSEECADLETELVKAHAREEVWEKAFRLALGAAILKQ